MADNDKDCRKRKVVGEDSIFFRKKRFLHP